jgi:hypothetical protein
MSATGGLQTFPTSATVGQGPGAQHSPVLCRREGLEVRVVLRCVTLMMVTLALSSPALAGDDELPAVTYPRLATSVRDARSFVPSGWKLVAIETGELGGGQRRDVAVLMRMADPANIKPVNSPYYKADDTNPYMLAIGFGRAEGFSLAASNSSLFPRETAPIHGDDPPGRKTVEIHRGVLTLSFAHLRGWDRLRFRWDGKAFTLIGYDCGGMAGGKFSSLSANYLTGKARIEGGDVSSAHPNVSNVGIRPGARPNLDQINWESDWAGTDARGATLTC